MAGPDSRFKTEHNGSYQIDLVCACLQEGQMSQIGKDCRQPLQLCPIKGPQWCKAPEGTIVGKLPELTCLQSSTFLAGDHHQQHSWLHLCLTSLMFLRSQLRTLLKAVPSRPSSSPAQSLAPPGWSCMRAPGPVMFDQRLGSCLSRGADQKGLID